MHTKMDPKLEVVTMVRRRAQKEHSAAPSQLAFHFTVVVESGAGAFEEPFANVKKLIANVMTDLINRLHSEISHTFNFDDEFMNASVNKGKTHTFKRGTAISKTNVMDGDVAELHADLGDLSQQLKMNAMCFDELEAAVNTMMTDVRHAAGGGGDILRGMSGGGFDDAADADGNAHDVLVVSSSPTGKISSQVQGTPLLNCCPR